jgi:hypothetical protein
MKYSTGSFMRSAKGAGRGGGIPLCRGRGPALGDADHGDVLDPHFGHDLMHRADLPRAAVDQQQVGPGLGFAVRVFLQQAGKAAGQHLFHHAEIVARGDLGALDVELAILAFDPALGAGDDHAAHGIGALIWLLS